MLKNLLLICSCSVLVACSNSDSGFISEPLAYAENVSVIDSNGGDAEVGDTLTIQVNDGSVYSQVISKD